MSFVERSSEQSCFAILAPIYVDKKIRPTEFFLFFASIGFHSHIRGGASQSSLFNHFGKNGIAAGENFLLRCCHPTAPVALRARTKSRGESTTTEQKKAENLA